MNDETKEEDVNDKELWLLYRDGEGHSLRRDFGQPDKDEPIWIGTGAEALSLAAFLVLAISGDDETYQRIYRLEPEPWPTEVVPY